MKKESNKSGLWSVVLVFFIAQVYLMTVNAQDITLKVSATKDTILIGDQLEMMIEVEKSNDFDVWFPIFEDSLTEHINVVQNLGIDTVDIDKNKSRLIQKYIITSFDSGVFEIPALKFPLSSKTGNDTIESTPVKLVVNTLPVDLEKPIKDIKSIYKAPITFAEIWPFLLIPVGLLLLILLLNYISKKIKAKEPIIPRFEKPKTPPEVIALRDLNSLKSKKLWQQGRIKEYYSLLTEIIRVYIEGRFDIMAMEQTSEEILERFEKTDYGTKEEYIYLRKMFLTADMVKFAKGTTLADENELHMANAYKFVENTTPVVEIEEDKENIEYIEEITKPDMIN